VPRTILYTISPALGYTIETEANIVYPTFCTIQKERQKLDTNKYVTRHIFMYIHYISVLIVDQGSLIMIITFGEIFCVVSH
jgi:hypothetical protein